MLLCLGVKFGSQLTYNLDSVTPNKIRIIWTMIGTQTLHQRIVQVCCGNSSEIMNVSSMGKLVHNKNINCIQYCCYLPSWNFTSVMAIHSHHPGQSVQENMSSLAAQLRMITLRTLFIHWRQITLQSDVQFHTGMHTNTGVVIQIIVGPSLLGSKNKETTVTSPIIHYSLQPCFWLYMYTRKV